MTDSLTFMPEHLIAKGWHRECYADPQDTNHCIKVVVNSNDADDQVSRTLAYYLEKEARFFQYSSRFGEAIRRLQSYQLQNNILTMSLKPKNLLLQKRENDSMAMFIIDNLGYAELLPLVCYFHSLGRAKTHRKWKRFGRLLKNPYPYLSDAFTSFR